MSKSPTPAKSHTGEPIEVLALTKYDRRAASSRHRFFNYIPLLADRGINVTAIPLLTDAYVERLFARRGLDLADVAGSFVRRFAAISTAHRYDLLWIEGEVFPRLPALAERLLDTIGCRYVIDLDDAIFHTYDQHPNALVRRLLGRKVDVVLRHATAVVAGNDYLAARARQAGAPRVVVIPTSIDERAYAATSRQKQEAQLTLGWIGSPATESYLATIAPEIEELCRSLPASLRLIGAAPDGNSFAKAVRRPWSEQTESAELASCDVGLAPLIGRPWDRGKCGLKAIQYMATGLPVLAAKVGALPDIVLHGETGFVYADGKEFTRFARELAANPGLRARMGAAGRERMAKMYSINRSVGALRDVLAASASPT